MNINEIYFTIQGEGRLAGKRSIFIRTNFCNLRCGFFNGENKELVLCDTKYTSWSPEKKPKLSMKKIINQIDEIIKNNKITESVDIVISGGEPLMIKEDILNLVRHIKRYVKKNHLISNTTIETNGTFYYDKIIKYVDLFSVSPKLLSSIPVGTEHEEMHKKNRINDQAFNQYANLFVAKKTKEKVQWKFVISREEDINEIISFLTKYQIPSYNIYLMPMGITKEQLENTRSIAWDLALKYHFNFTDRLHIIRHDNLRGV